MKLPLDNIDVPIALTAQICGVLVSSAGIAATTIYGSFHYIAAVSPEELAIQPLHVILITFIIALSTFIVLILRAVWGKGVNTVNRFSDAIEMLIRHLEELKESISDMKKHQNNSLDRFQELSLNALREATQAAKASKK
jgi:hypothetical protein